MDPGEASPRAMLPAVTKLRNAVCPACHTDVTVTYWPYGVPLYTVHVVRGSNRDCGHSLRPIVDGRPAKDRPRST